MRRHKPAPEAYHSVAAALETIPGDICLIASGVWDAIGGTPRWRTPAEQDIQIPAGR